MHVVHGHRATRGIRDERRHARTGIGIAVAAQSFGLAEDSGVEPRVASHELSLAEEVREIPHLVPALGIDQPIETQVPHHGEVGRYIALEGGQHIPGKHGILGHDHHTRSRVDTDDFPCPPGAQLPSRLHTVQDPERRNAVQAVA